MTVRFTGPRHATRAAHGTGPEAERDAGYAKRGRRQIRDHSDAPVVSSGPCSSATTKAAWSTVEMR